MTGEEDDVGRDEEFRDFTLAHYRTLVRAAVLIGCRPQDAEDAVQDALARCYAAWTRVSAADNREGYVYRVLVHSIARSRRRRWHGEVPLDVLPEPGVDGDLAAHVSLSQSVRACLHRLSPAHREVLVLRYFADLSEAQIARALGIAPGTVKSRAGRAIAALAGDPALEALASRKEEH